MEKTMSDNELADRLLAVKLRLEKKPIEEICQVLGRTEVWFHKWWRRYQEEGPNGLYDQTRTYVHPSRTSPELERAIVNIRKRLASQQHPDTRYSLVGASSILAELAALHIRPLPSERTVERVLERNGITVPRVQLAPSLSKTTYPKPQVDDSNQLHQVDSVGPIYLKGKKQRYYIFTAKDVYDGGVFIKLYRSRQSDVILDFLGEAWKHLGIPAQAQFDNAREVVGWGSAARYLSRVLRLCLRFGVEPILIPPAMPWWDGSVENFNGWFQPRIFQRRYTQVSALQRELLRLQDTVNNQHPQQKLGGLTSAQYRRQHKLHKLPPSYTIPIETVPIAAGRITFIRQVTLSGNIHLLSQTFKVGKRLKGEFVKVILDTRHAYLTLYRQGRILKRWPYAFLKK
jgi:putative transposase